MTALAALMLATALASGAEDAHSAQEYSFDVSEFEKKPYELGGQIELKQERLRLRPQSVLYRLNFGSTARDRLDRTTGTLELFGRARAGDFVADARMRSVVAGDALGISESTVVLDAGVRWSPREGLSADAGKRVQRWGKGYAWNPVAFVERPKDPNDPQLSREGYVMASVDWVRTFDAPLAAVGLTALAVPSSGSVNSDFGPRGHANPAAKLYLLYHDTDIDFVWAGKGSRPTRLGVDFSRNLGSNLEVHAEWSRIRDAERAVVDDHGRVFTERRDASSTLVGVRYLTESEVTWIAEYYRTGTGYSHPELEAFYRFAEAASSTAATGPSLARLESLARGAFGRPNPGRRYVYLRASAKDPGGLLYFTPALTSIVNVEDRSWSISPELTYNGVSNLEIRARVLWTAGDRHSDFGEKPNRMRAEIYARYYF